MYYHYGKWREVVLFSEVTNVLPYTANISSRKNFKVHRSSSKFLSLKVAAAPSHS